MWNIHQAYIDGAFVPVQGSEVLDVVDPTTEEVIGRATMGHREDAKRAIAAAGRAQSFMRGTAKADRIDMLRRLQAAVLARSDQLRDVTIEEYGGPWARAQWVSRYASECFAGAAQTLEEFPLTHAVGSAQVVLQPVGVAALIAPWNSAVGTICSKLASALAAGCATVIKPSELSPIQTQVLAEALHDADLPPGVINILLGRGTDVGDEISTSPGVARISFTGSTATGKLIARAAVDTMKRVSLSLSGKSASIVLDDADLDLAVPQAIAAAFMNNGQACVAGTRLLVPRARAQDIIEGVRGGVAAMRVGDPRDPATEVGPLASRAQFDRVRRFIRRGLEQGATLVVGGESRPEHLARGFFVRPTVFADVRHDMDIAREEIFGPVLSILAYEDEAEAIRIANDSVYGLQAYVFSSEPERARRLALQLEAGTVLINRTQPELLAPFGGVKQSGIGREFGAAGLASYLESKTIGLRA